MFLIFDFYFDSVFEGSKTSIDWVAISIASLTLFIGYLALRHQFISTLTALLMDKAREANSYIKDSSNNQIPNSYDAHRGILHSVITTEEILNYLVYKRYSWNKMLFPQPEKLKIVYFLQLHTEIRSYLAELEKLDRYKEHIEKFGPEKQQKIETKRERCKIFLSRAIKKEVNKEFAKLHCYSKQ